MNPSQIARRIYKICEYLWNPWENKSQVAEAISNRCQGAKESPTDSTDEHGYWVRGSFPQIAQRSTDTGTYKICEICGIRGRIKSQAAEAISNICQGAKESPTDSTDEHGYWVRRCFPQIAQRSTDIGIYKICENLWNLWENQISSSRGYLQQIAQRSTDIGCEGVSHE